MIAKITRTIQFSNSDYADPVVRHDSGPWFAHSVEEALAWVKSFPALADAEVVTAPFDTLEITTEWQPYERSFAMIIDEAEDETARFAYTRSCIDIRPVQTVGIGIGAISL
jgi:hypothetical protein